MEYDIDYASKTLLDDIITKDEAGLYKEITELLRLTLQLHNSVMNTDINYMISPVLNSKGEFFNTEVCSDDMPQHADANGAYNVARKAIWAINKIKELPEDKLDKKANLNISNNEWLIYAQKNTKL